MKGTYGIFVVNKLKKFLVVHPTRTPKDKQWGIPKGGKNKGEEPLQSAIREVLEETGLDLTKTKGNFFSIGDQPYKNKNKRLFAWVFISQEDLSDFKFKCDVMVDEDYPENDNWKWISFDEADIIHEAQLKMIPKVSEIINTVVN